MKPLTLILALTCLGAGYQKPVTIPAQDWKPGAGWVEQMSGCDDFITNERTTQTVWWIPNTGAIVIESLEWRNSDLLVETWESMDVPGWKARGGTEPREPDET